MHDVAQTRQAGKTGTREQAGRGAPGPGSSRAAAGDGTVLLIDEAHNLLERGREMYSAQISYTQVRKFRKSVKTVWPRLWKAMKGLVHVLNVLKKEAEEDVGKIRVLHDWTFHWEEKITEQTGQTEQTMEESARAEDDPDMGPGRDPLPQKPQENRVPALRQELSSAVEEVRNQIQWILEQENRSASLYEAAKPAELSERAESSDRAEPEAGSRPTGSEQAGLTELLEFYFGLCHFGQMLDGIDGHYIVYTVKGTGSPSGGGFSLHLYCADPSGHLRACMNKLTAAVFFSATFLPIQYYKGLLGGTEEDFEMYARSSFSPVQRKVVIVRDVTSRYRDRNEESYARIARSIGQVVTCRPGNYMVYFPSYAFLEKVLEAFCEAFHPAVDRRDVGRDGFPAEEGKEKLAKPAEEGKEKPAKPAEKDFYVIAQRREMDDQERAAFLQAFEDNLSDRHLIGFCVLGGMFSEGIDLRNDRLIGSLIVGTGIPPVEPQRELLKDYFSGQGRNGYDFAYRYPGMNKVLQAAGRVIRTAEDVGIVVLMDGRFAERSSRELFPLEWGQPESVESGDAADRIRRFWEENQ
jgi:Rad3-related DNA helicase